LQGKWEEKRINIEFDTSDEIYFTGDTELLFQVWVNILSNAIKYTDIEGMIKVLIKKEENIVVEITDDGIGLTEEEAKRVFQRFYKAEKDRNSSGTGLGLSIAKKL
jgi:two-component system phosphate regulon sensor histidine kinase PhoR